MPRRSMKRRPGAGGKYKVYRPNATGRSSTFNNQQHSYGDGWEVISAYVRKRDGYRCQVAKLTAGRFTCTGYFPPPFQHLLHAHHIVERGRGGEDHPRNLLSLCVECHSKIHGKYLGRITDKQRRAAKRP